MDPPSEAPPNSIQRSWSAPITPSSIITDQANNGIKTHLSSYPKYEPNIWDYWQQKQMLTDLDQLDLNDSTSSKPIKVLENFLDDPRVLQQSYNLWTELRSQKGVPDLFTKERSTTDTNWPELYQKENLDVVLNWDPFNSLCDVWDTVESVLIFSIEEYDSTSSINDLKDLNYAMAVSEVISSYLKYLFQCLINANSAFCSAAVIQEFSFDLHPSHKFCSSSYASSMSTERGGSYMSSLSSSHSTATSSYPNSISTSKIDQQRPALEIEPIYEEENIPGVRIFFLFVEAISNLKHLANKLVHKKYGHVLSNAFQGAFQAAMEQKLEPLGFHHSTWKELEKIEPIEASSLKERRRDWEKTFRIIVKELLPWPKFLCEEIFSEYTLELKEACFFEYAELCLMPLLGFADEACSAMPGQAKRIFHQLYVHDVLELLSHNISARFVVRHQSDLIQLSFGKEVKKVLERLGKAILEALEDFRSQILDDQSGINNNNEVDVHHLTRHTMSYMKELSGHRVTIDSLDLNYYSFSDREKSILSGPESGYEVVMSDDSFCCLKYMLFLFFCLESKLMEKSQLLKEDMAAQVFCINNLNYMMEEVARPQFKILGDKWVQEQHKKIEGYLDSYKASVLAEVESCSAGAMKASEWKHIIFNEKAEIKLSRFISSVMERSKPWASWKVPDPLCRDKLRKATLDVVVSVYTDLRYKLHPGILKDDIVEMSIEKELEGLTSHILDLFEG